MYTEADDALPQNSAGCEKHINIRQIMLKSVDRPAHRVIKDVKKNLCVSLQPKQSTNTFSCNLLLSTMDSVQLLQLSYQLAQFCSSKMPATQKKIHFWTAELLSQYGSISAQLVHLSIYIEIWFSSNFLASATLEHWQAWFYSFVDKNEPWHCWVVSFSSPVQASVGSMESPHLVVDPPLRICKLKMFFFIFAIV